MDNQDGGFGLSHLAAMPITLSFGFVLLAVLALLIVLRLVFGEVSIGGGVR